MGSIWISLAPVRRASTRMRLTIRITGAPSALSSISSRLSSSAPDSSTTSTSPTLSFMISSMSRDWLASADMRANSPLTSSSEATSGVTRMDVRSLSSSTAITSKGSPSATVRLLPTRDTGMRSRLVSMSRGTRSMSCGTGLKCCREMGGILRNAERARVMSGPLTSFLSTRYFSSRIPVVLASVRAVSRTSAVTTLDLRRMSSMELFFGRFAMPGPPCGYRRPRTPVADTV